MMRTQSLPPAAGDLIAEELARQGWQEADLPARRKSDAAKLVIAARRRPETTLWTKALAARMHLGSAKAANRSLHRYLSKGGEAPTIGCVPGTGGQVAGGGKLKTSENSALQAKPGGIKMALMKRTDSLAGAGSRWPIIPKGEDKQVCPIP